MIPSCTLHAPLREAIRRYTSREVAIGVRSPGEIVDGALRRWGSAHPADLVERIAAYFVNCGARRAEAARRNRPVATDCNRLDSAFAALESGGVVARQHYHCCGSCGAAAIREEMERLAAHRPARGYVYYHQQAWEAALEQHLLHLGYRAADGTDESTKTIGAEVVAALMAEGLRPNWDGRPSSCIAVPLVWRGEARDWHAP